MRAALQLAALAVACARPEDGSATRWNSAPPPPPQRRTPNGWVLLERALQATSGMARGVGEVITLGTGGVFRVTGNMVRSVGTSIDAVGNAVAGESHGRSGSPSDGSPGSGADPKPMDATGATRRLLSRPMRVVSTTFKSVGDGITVLGDATERMAGEALGIVPDAFGVLQSGVGALRKRVEFDVNDNRQDWRSGAEAEKGRGRERVGGNGGGEGTGHTPFWLGAHRGATGAGGSALASRGPWGRSRPGSAGGNGRATPRDYGGSAPLPARASSAKTKPYGRASKAKLDGRLTPEHVFIGPRATPHVALALVCLALCARLAGGGPLGLLAAVACGVACVGYLRVVEAAQQAELLRVAEARAMRGWQLRVGAPAESVGWLNAVLAAGWETTFGPYLHESLRDSLVESLRQLGPTLPRTLASIELCSLNVGGQPPLIVSAAAARALGPTPNAQPGAAAVVEFELDAPDAHLEFEFRFANIASRPRLRVSRPRLRGTARLHWEWIKEYPYVGRLRWTFLHTPAMDAGLEPIGGLDVTQLPAVGPFLQWTMRTNLLSSCVYPAWVSTDMRTSTRDASAAIAAAIASAEADQPLADREEKKVMELVEEQTVKRALAGGKPRATRTQPRRDQPGEKGTGAGAGGPGAGGYAGAAPASAASALGLTPTPPPLAYPGGLSRRLNERLAAAAARAAAGDAGDPMGEGRGGGGRASMGEARGNGAGPGAPEGVAGAVPDSVLAGGVGPAGEGVGATMGSNAAGEGEGVEASMGDGENRGVGELAVGAGDAEELADVVPPAPVLVEGLLATPTELPTPSSSPRPHADSFPISPPGSGSSDRRDLTGAPAGHSTADIPPPASLSLSRDGVRAIPANPPPAHQSPAKPAPANPLTRARRLFRLGSPPPPPPAASSPDGWPAPPPAGGGDTGGGGGDSRGGGADGRGGGGKPGRGGLPPTRRVTYRLDRTGRLVPSTSDSTSSSSPSNDR